MGTITPNAVIVAMGSAGLVAGVPAWKSVVGFADPLTFIAPNRWVLTLSEAIAADDADVIAQGRNGWLANVVRVSDTSWEVQTMDGNGPGIGAFDVIASRVPVVAAGTTPDPDPLGVPIGGGGVSAFSPNVYFVTPTLPLPPGMFSTIGAAQAQAVIDQPALGGPGEYPRALVVVFPGSYPERVTMLAGIDIIAWDQKRAQQTRIAPPVGPGTGLLRFTPPVGSDPATTHASWRGIDIVGADPAEPMIVLDGADPATLFLSEHRVTGLGSATLQVLNSGPFPSRPRVIGQRVTFENDAGVVLQCTAGVASVELSNCELARTDSIDNPCIVLTGNVAPGPDVSLVRCEVRGFVQNDDGSIVLALCGTQTATVPVLAANNPAAISSQVIFGALISGAAGQPLVSGIGGFQHLLVGVIPTGVQPFALTLNGGAGPGDSIPASLTSTAFAALFVAPPPQTIDEALIRIAAAVFAGAPGGPIP